MVLTCHAVWFLVHHPFLCLICGYCRLITSIDFLWELNYLAKWSSFTQNEVSLTLKDFCWISITWTSWQILISYTDVETHSWLLFLKSSLSCGLSKFDLLCHLVFGIRVLAWPCLAVFQNWSLNTYSIEI